jgi:mannosyltransferase OCH1-like enzyme
MTLPKVNAGVFGRIKRRMAKQAHRTLSIYILFCAIVVFILSQLSSHGQTPPAPAYLTKRNNHNYQATLTTGAFPRKIWQSWKVDPLDFEERDLLCARSWVTKNPGFRYEVLTDGNDMQYVETHFGTDGLNRPDIVYVYQSLTARIIKADLLRYLVMYIEGGVYVDIDVEALKPIDRFIPDTGRFQEDNMDMIIGIEVDQPQFANHSILGPKSRSFCQWTFVCKPRLPVMLRLVENIIKWLYDVSERQKVPISQVTLNFDDVISGTGPSAFTQAILAEMSQREGREVVWDDFHNMGESKLVGGILVLTVEAFAAGQGHSDSGTHGSRNALVKHHYHASGWPMMHPRYSHPIYGPVEACNWDQDCVNLWDFSIASFEALPPEEQARLIAEQQQATAENPAFPGQPLQEHPQPLQMNLEVPIVLSEDPVVNAEVPGTHPEQHQEDLEVAHLEPRHLQDNGPAPHVSISSLPSLVNLIISPTVMPQPILEPSLASAIPVKVQQTVVPSLAVQATVSILNHRPVQSGFATVYSKPDQKGT